MSMTRMDGSDHALDVVVTGQATQSNLLDVRQSEIKIKRIHECVEFNNG